MIVLDATVAVKAYLEDEDSDAAIALLTGEQRLLAPALIRLEVCAALCRRVRKGEMEAEEARVRCAHWLKSLDNGLFLLTPDEELITDAVTLATELNQSVQACLYLAVARKADAALITADPAFHERVKPVFGKVALLRENQGT